MQTVCKRTDELQKHHLLGVKLSVLPPTFNLRRFRVAPDGDPVSLLLTSLPEISECCFCNRPPTAGILLLSSIVKLARY